MQRKMISLDWLAVGVLTAALLGWGALVALPALAADPTTDIGTLDKETAERTHQKAPYSPYAGRNFPTRPFFGDTHTHTSFSMDAGAFGARLGPKDAYRFAKGEEVIASSGQRAKLSRPLDFMVVTDHSDNMGFFPDLFAGKPEVLADPTGRRWYDMIQSGKGAGGGHRDHRGLFAGEVAQEAGVSPRDGTVPVGLAGDDQGRRRGQRSGPLHGVHRF